jgi:predicted RNA-binding protein with PUA-like domain
MARRFWLMKCEPAAYTIDDLARDGRASWEGVRNYQARNFMRDQMQEGDGVLFYASNAEPSGVTGLASIARAGYPDHFAWKKGHTYFDEAGSAESPVWYMVDVAFVERFADVVPLETLKCTPGLEKMLVIQKGSRLSIQPVTPEEYDIVVKLGRSRVKTADAGHQPSRAPRAAAKTAGSKTATRRGAKSKSARR